MPTEISAPSIEALGDDLLAKLLREKKIAREFQERRHADWNENYELYRNKVKTNRLTQRQAVNIPLMKETVKTLLSKIDDPPTIDWKEQGGNELKEVILQELWNHAYEEGNFEGVDLQDKKSVLLYGRAFKKLNIKDGEVSISALDVFDVVVDPMTDPLDIETARFILHQNIFKPVREILADDRYSTEGKQSLKIWLTSTAGIVQSSKNKEEYEKKLERLKSMGVDSDDFPLFAGGDVVVNLTEHYTKVWDSKSKRFVRRVCVYADDHTLLLDETLMDLIGVDFFPFVTWGEDIETTDIWSDGPADLVRTPNKVINIWFSQMAENRTLRNFQMHWYDATKEGYKPQTYEPGPGRMLPAPGNPSETIAPVDISGLDETMQSIDFIIKLVERGTSATAIEKGVSERSQITLGEVQTLVGKAMERTLAMAKLYRRAWQELAMKWYGLLDANASKAKTLYKQGKNGRLWPKKVFPVDWKSKEGFRAFARSSSEQDEEKTKSVQRFQFLLQQFPQNTALRRIAQKRMLEVADLTAEEVREVSEEEKRQQELADEQNRLQQEALQNPQAAQQMMTQGQAQAPIEASTGLEGPLGGLAEAMDTRNAESKLSELKAL